ncbi:MAG: hypothetical protein WD361_14815 [Gracilimonas sp.]
MKSTFFPTIVLIIALGFTSCSLFDNEQIPECLKKEQNNPSEISQCYQPVYFGSPAWHPDGEWIAAEHTDSFDINQDGFIDSTSSGIWLVHAETGQTQPLLPFGDAPAWNPAGTHLAVHGGGGIYTVEVTSLEPAQFDTSSITLLTDFDAPAFFPTWSGDGEWIAFDTSYEHENGAYVVWKVKNDGSELKKVSKREVGGGRQANWSKQNDKITFTSYVTGGAEGPEIFSMKADGSGSKQLTNNGENYYPKFSPDGKKIAFTHQMPYEFHVVVMNSDGSNKKVITNNHSREATWSPDGEQLVYILLNLYEAVPGNGQLWIMDSNGNNKKQLTNFKGEAP